MSDIEITRLSVALTDVLVFLVCVASAYFLNSQLAVRKNLKQSYMILFISVGMAALFGAIHHQYFEEATSFLGTLPRFISMISIGYAAMNLWLIGGEFSLSGAQQMNFQKIFRILMYGYVVLVVLYEHKFWVAIAFYFPAVLFFLAVVSYRYAQHKEKVHKWAIAGLLVTVVAAAVQALQISLIPVYVNHSSFYHLIQIPGIYLLYKHASLTISTAEY